MTDETPRHVDPVSGHVFTDAENAEIDRRVALRKEREAWFPNPLIAYDCEVIAALLCAALRYAEHTHDETRPDYQIDPRHALDAGDELGAAMVRAAWLGAHDAKYMEISGRAVELVRIVHRFVRSQFDCAWYRHLQARARAEVQAAMQPKPRRRKRAKD
jgi:hypothetical protein